MTEEAVHRAARTPADDAAGPRLRLALADPDGRLAAVRLWQEIGLPASVCELVRDAAGTWRLDLPWPAARRLEYLFDVTDVDGGRALVPDPVNLLRAGSPFGDHSVVEAPGYAPPAWLTAAAPDGGREPFAADVPQPCGPVAGTVWSSPGLVPDRAAPLLVVHDGPEYDALSGVTRYLAAGTASGDLPPLRAALLEPGDRNRRYAADPDYADALAGHVLPDLRSRFPVTAVVGVGTSLGALAWLHAQRRHPDLVDGLFLQSGSFFTAELDPQESGFARFGDIVAAVADVHAGRPGDGARAVRPVPVAVTCGTVEENLANNRLVVASLRAQGYPVTSDEVPDGHTWTAWRDSLHPALSRLVALVLDTVQGYGQG